MTAVARQPAPEAQTMPLQVDRAQPAIPETELDEPSSVPEFLHMVEGRIGYGYGDGDGDGEGTSSSIRQTS